MDLIPKCLVCGVLLLTLIPAGMDACFIRNCPPGGKRGMPVLDHGIRQCQACGSSKGGQCIGPNICCGSDFGCLMGTSETRICARENDNPNPCRVEGDQCGSNGQGNCVAPGLCCDSVACAQNDSCESSRDSGASPELMSLLKRLLQDRTVE